jgi:hypothetical protein
MSSDVVQTRVTRLGDCVIVSIGQFFLNTEAAQTLFYFL